MLLNQEIFRQLTTYPGLAALISDRVFPMGVAIQKTSPLGLPYVTHHRVAEVPTYTSARRAATLDEMHVQFDIWAGDPDSARNTAAQLKAALDNWTSPAVNRAFIRHDSDFYESDTKLYRVSVDAQIWNQLSHP